jgi:hypothetical protein
VLGVRRWRELVKDREKWRGIVGQAKLTQRSVAPTEEEEEEEEEEEDLVSLCCEFGFKANYEEVPCPLSELLRTKQNECCEETKW